MHTTSSTSSRQVKLDSLAASPGHRAVESLAAQAAPSVSRLELSCHCLLFMLKCSTVPCLVCQTPRPPRTREESDSRVSAGEEELRLLWRSVIVLQHGIC